MLNNDLEKEKNKYLDMISMVHDYMHNVKSNILEVEILYYVAKELGIDDKVEYYDSKNSLFEKLGISIKDEICYEIVEDEINNSLNEKKVYLNVKKIMLNSIFSNKKIDLYSLINERNTYDKDITKMNKM